MPRLNEYVLTSEAAQILGVCPNTVRAWAENGTIPVFKNPANGYRMFRRHDLENFLQGISDSMERIRTSK